MNLVNSKSLKVFVCMVSILGVLFANCYSSIALLDPIKFDVDMNTMSTYLNNKVYMVKPILVNGRIYLPLDEMSKVFDGTSEWIAEQKRQNATLNNKKVSMWIGYNFTLVNDIMKLSDVPPILVNGKVYVSFRYLGQIMDCKVYWDDIIRKATFTNKTGMTDTYVFKHSKKSILTDLEIAQKDVEALKIARYEILARYGYVFDDANINGYFATKTWYTEKPDYKSDYASLSYAEQRNINLLDYYIDIKANGRDRIVVDKGSLKLLLFLKGKFTNSFSVAIGKNSTPTPVGYFTVVNKLYNPGGPYGTRWLGLSKPNYGIHGTDNPLSIGTMASHGCVRMHNSDVQKLYELVYVGFPVNIK